MTNPPHEDSLIGKQLGDYVLTQRLATGGMARIYQGVDQRLGRHAAVKVLDFEKLVEDDMPTQRFQREARAVAMLDHPNVIPIYQYGEQDGVYFLAMKLIKGKDLAHELNRLRIEGERMDVPRALRILEQVASALDVAHAAGIIHRDVKPSNILLDQKDAATLTDFGLVFQPAIDITQGTAFGTPRYISPEQALSSNSAVPQSDIYSLAVIAYQILAGQVPFSGDTPLKIALAHVNNPPPPPRDFNPEIPEAAEIELLKALDKEPVNRHHKAADFVAALQRAYNPPMSLEIVPVIKPDTVRFDTGSPIEISTPAAIVVSTPAPTPPRTRSPWLLPAIVSVLIVLIGGALLVNLNPGSGVVSTPTSAEITLSEPTPAETIAALVLPSATETNILVAAGDAEMLPVSAVYSDTVFTIMNANDQDLAVGLLRFERGDAIYRGDQIVRQTLPAGTCFRIQLQARQTTLPPECGSLHSETLLPDPLRFFWRSDSADAAAFNVLYNDQLLTTCPTVSRGGSNQCTFTLPAVSAALSP